MCEFSLKKGDKKRRINEPIDRNISGIIIKINSFNKLKLGKVL